MCVREGEMCRLPLACLNRKSERGMEPRQGQCLALGFKGVTVSAFQGYGSVHFQYSREDERNAEGDIVSVILKNVP